MTDLPYTIVIGLEVHVQLLTESKMFCGCATRFGQPANTQTCPVCMGLPGALPVINRKAFELALKAAAALNCQIAPFTKWDRKNYFYPDLPKGYQISQYDLPLAHDGWLEIGCRRIRILRAHLEEDAGKSMHDEGADSPHPNPLPKGEGTEMGPPNALPKGEGTAFGSSAVADSRVDLNRAGTPLLEIVSQPDIRSPEEAKAYLTELKLLMGYLGVSDCNMQEGSLRVDANVNLHVNIPDGQAATPIVEVKNMNSFRAVERALAYEAQRQWDEWQTTGLRLGETPKTTRGWDEVSQTTRLQRSKEESSDYRYFPDPDLPPVTVSEAEMKRIAESLGELPGQLRTRLERSCGLTPYDSDVLVSQGRPLVDYFLAVADVCGDGKAASNWVQQDVLRWLGERHVDVDQYPVAPRSLGELIAKVHGGAFSTSRGREVLGLMVGEGKSLANAIASLGIAEVDDSALLALCRELVAANPKVAAEVRDGKLKGLGSLIGQAKAKNPNVKPNRVREMCLELIQAGQSPESRP
ncbi:MAG: Asp-tRNA(Asn)/Glu-tRNA(Gln) amidotransferase subunit GatB [Thermoguttaceae bacterium]